MSTNGTPAPDPVQVPAPSNDAEKIVMFFDVDNCLYSHNTKVQKMASHLIDKYYATHLDLPFEEVFKLRKEYRKNYGLAIEGLVRHHQIDPLHFNAKVDDALPLEGVIKPDAELRQLLEDIDKSRVTLWLFTNAYVTHARRVVKLLGIDDLFDGLTYCDYAKEPLVCKPSEAVYKLAMEEAGVSDVSRCFFVDDSYANCQKAQQLGWTTAHLVEEGLEVPKTQASQFQISHLRELRDVFPMLFKSNSK